MHLPLCAYEPHTRSVSANARARACVWLVVGWCRHSTSRARLPAPTACAAETSRIACPCTHRLVSRGASHQQDPQPHRHRLLAPILRDNARYLACQLHKSHVQFPVPFRGLHVLRHPRLPAAIHEGRGVLLRRAREADPCGVFPFDPPLTHTDGADEAHPWRQTSAHLVTDNKSMLARLAECPSWICAAGRVPSRTIASFCTTAKHIDMSSLSAAMSRANARLAPVRSRGARIQCPRPHALLRCGQKDGAADGCAAHRPDACRTVRSHGAFHRQHLPPLCNRCAVGVAVPEAVSARAAAHTAKGQGD
ncbi:hypothetical protein C8J57DRAFT_668179 [Mycena rebaudengoi]|nr:hypothetical protein C8J57DRAFT_668179 [Mycena rebaudengoi]